jgi:hypothetical protein
MQNMPPNTIAFYACVPLDRYIGGLAAAGIDTVGRYLAPGAANAWKVMAPAEAVALAIAGIKVFPIHETNTVGRSSVSPCGQNFDFRLHAWRSRICGPSGGSCPGRSRKCPLKMLTIWLGTTACHAEGRGFEPRRSRH